MNSRKYRRTVRVAMAFFVCWMVLQAVRAFATKEPYPAIFYPGFESNGSAPVREWRLMKLTSEGWSQMEYTDTNLSHIQFRKLLGGVVKFTDRSDSVQLNVQLNVMRKFQGIKEGDSVKVVERLWIPDPSGYHISSAREIRLRL